MKCANPGCSSPFLPDDPTLRYCPACGTPIKRAGGSGPNPVVFAIALFVLIALLAVFSNVLPGMIAASRTAGADGAYGPASGAPQADAPTASAVRSQDAASAPAAAPSAVPPGTPTIPAMEVPVDATSEPIATSTSQVAEPAVVDTQAAPSGSRSVGGAVGGAVDTQAAPSGSRSVGGAVGTQAAPSGSRSVELLDANRARLTLADGITLDVFRVPTGDFMMGSDESPDEAPVRRVTLAAYWMGATEVTVRQFEAFVRDAGYITQPEQKGVAAYYTSEGWQDSVPGADWRHPRGPSSGVSDEQPVTQVTYFDAIAFCKWLSRRTGLKISLPTEEQWEKAARGTDGRRYPWGDQAPDGTRAFFGQPDAQPIPVASFPAGTSPYGLYDMAGNVWEWTTTPYSEGGREFRILRGGGMHDDASRIRSSMRSWGEPDGGAGALRGDHVGFRIRVSDLAAQSGR